MSRAAFVRPLVAMGISSALAAQMLATPVPFAIPTTSGFGELMLGDVDGDGHVDVVVPDDSALVHALLGDGRGAFGTARTSANGSGLVTSSRLVDLDGDGKLDVLVGGVLGRMRWLVGDGSGTFALRADLQGIGRLVAVVDLDRDRWPDLLGYEGFSLRVARGSATGPLPATPLTPPAGTPVPFGISGFTVGDVDGDGVDDVLLAGFLSVDVYYGDGLGGFSRSQQLPPAAFVPRQLTDVDDDGDLDLVVMAPTAGARIGRNEGGGAFTMEALPGTAANVFGFVAAGDLDGDGLEEILSIGTNELLVSARDASGQFAVVERHAVAAIEGVEIADVDEDGRPDVLALGSAGVSVLRNVRGTPRGLAAYGTGTPTCRGAIGMTGSREPNLGALDFRVLCSNAPANASGVLVVGARAPSGIALPGLGLTVHLLLGWPVAAMASDVGGAASVALPLPPSRWLAGLTVHAQSFWIGDPGLGDTCSPALAELASSRGLAITLRR